MPFALCFVCNSKGHLARDCPSNASKGVYPRGGSCMVCGEITHLARDCPVELAEKKAQHEQERARRGGFQAAAEGKPAAAAAEPRAAAARPAPAARGDELETNFKMPTGGEVEEVAGKSGKGNSKRRKA
jgi:hypothetical protein